MTLPDEHLDAALRALAHTNDGMTSSPMVEARLANVVDGIARRRTRWRWAAPTIAAAALLAIGILALFQQWRQATNGSQVTVSVAETSASEVSTAFFVLPSGELPIASARLVRLDVPRSALQRYGLAGLESPGSAETVLAEVLVDDAGLARAVRFVHSGPVADRR